MFNFDFVTSPGQSVSADHDLSTGLTHSQSSPTISTSFAGTNQPAAGMVWMGGVNPLE